MECYKCGISGERVKLFDAITREGIVKVCEKCSRSEDNPVIRRPTQFQLKEIERKPTVYERLSRAAGINPSEKRVEKSDFLVSEEANLKKIVDKNYAEKIIKDSKKIPRPELVDNFHWVLMRARRSKKVTQKQMAEAIGEAEVAIKMAEEGFLPENNYLLNKMQNYLEISLFKDGVNPIEEKPAYSREIIFDRKNPKTITISDLKNIKKDSEKSEGYEFLNKEKADDREKRKSDKDLSEEEIRKLIFKR